MPALPAAKSATGMHERLRDQLVDVREPLRVAARAAIDARVERLARDAERLSGSRAAWPAVSTSSTRQVDRRFVRLLLLRLRRLLRLRAAASGGVFAGRLLLPAAFSSSSFFGSFGGVRGPGFVFVAASER